MKVAYLAESAADRAALAILTEAMLGCPTQSATHAGLEVRGWSSAMKVLPVVLRQLHYHSDAQGLVFVVDSDEATPHLPDHERTPDFECRLCEMRRIAAEALMQVRPRSGQPPLRIALGLAVPTIEAWLLCGVNSRVTEAAWANGLRDAPGRLPYTKKELKEQLYGTSHPTLALATEKMKDAALRLAHNLDQLEGSFPQGFGALRRALNGWPADDAIEPS